MEKIIPRWAKADRYPTSSQPVIACDLFKRKHGELNFDYQIRIKPKADQRRSTVAIPVDVALVENRHKHFGQHMKGRLFFLLLLEDMVHHDQQNMEFPVSRLPAFKKNHVRKGKPGLPDFCLMDFDGNIVT